MKVDSSHIAEIDWSPQTKTLIVKFHYQKRAYAFVNVPEEVWQQFQHSTSSGAFFHKWIKPNFKQVRVV